MSSSIASFYAKFPVIQTFEAREISNIDDVVEKISSHYERLRDQFCVRILLPRSDKLDPLARKLGLVVQQEFMLSLRRKSLRPNIREIRYIHDENNYGWLLLGAKIYEDKLVKTQEREEP